MKKGESPKGVEPSTSRSWGGCSTAALQPRPGRPRFLISVLKPNFDSIDFNPRKKQTFQLSPKPFFRRLPKTFRCRSMQSRSEFKSGFSFRKILPDLIFAQFCKNEADGGFLQKKALRRKSYLLKMGQPWFIFIERIRTRVARMKGTIRALKLPRLEVALEARTVTEFAFCLNSLASKTWAVAAAQWLSAHQVITRPWVQILTDCSDFYPLFSFSLPISCVFKRSLNVQHGWFFQFSPNR